MSTLVKETEKVVARDGAPLIASRTRPPIFPLVAAPLAAISAAILASRLAGRRRAAAKPSVYWSLAIASDNRVSFRPTMAPRFRSLFVRGGRPRSRRPFRRSH